MAIQYSVAVRNAKLDAVETTMGASPILRIYSGAAPANCAASATGTLIAEMALPSDFMQDAASGVKEKSGTWEDLNANAGAVAGYFRIWDNAGTTCHKQGTVTETGMGGDMEVDNTDINVNQKVTVTSFSITAGNA